MHIFTVLRVFGKQSCLLFPSLLSGRKVAEPNKTPVDVKTEVQQNQSTKAFFVVVVVRENMHSGSYNTDDNRKNCFSITAFSNIICVICYIRHCCTQKHKLKQRTKL